MPCIIIKTNQTIEKKDQINHCKLLSVKLSGILGKPENYVMTLLEDQVSMTMSGTTEPTAYIELKSINLPEDDSSKLSNELCNLISTLLSITPDRIYIEFSNAQRHLWGWNGGTF